MANGILCICGYQEADHMGGMTAAYNGDKEAMKKDHPRLVRCRGYKPVTNEGNQIPENNSFYSEVD